MPTNTTTPEALRDQMIAVIKAILPRAESGQPFKPFTNELGANFQEWAEGHADACFRHFQVRATGETDVPTISNTDIEEQTATFLVRVAYPQSNRWGGSNALDRDDVMDRDAQQINRAIGMAGGANFVGMDACWIRGGVEPRVEGAGVDFLELRLTYIFMRDNT